MYIDALDPSRYYMHAQARGTIMGLAAGFRALGLQTCDAVCLHIFNDASQSGWLGLASYSTSVKSLQRYAWLMKSCRLSTQYWSMA